MTEGGEAREGRFHHVPGFSDGLLAQVFSREVFSLLLGEKLVSQALVEKIMGWRHSGFSVHSKVKASTKEEAERVGKYMIRPVLSLERLSFDEKEGKVRYRHGKEGEDRLSGTLDGRRGRLLVCAALLVFFIWIVLYPRKVLLNPVRVVSPSGEKAIFYSVSRSARLIGPGRFQLREDDRAFRFFFTTQKPVEELKISLGSPAGDYDFSLQMFDETFSRGRTSGEIRTVSLRNPARYRLRQTSYYELILNLGKGSGVQTELNPYLLIIDFYLNCSNLTIPFLWSLNLTRVLRMERP